MKEWKKAVVYRSRDEADWTRAKELLAEAGIAAVPFAAEERDGSRARAASSSCVVSRSSCASASRGARKEAAKAARENAFMTGLPLR